MAIQYKVDFEKLEWKSPMDGVRDKHLDQNGVRLRLVEYSKKMQAHWCERGHCGYLISGRMEVEFSGTMITYGAGDAIFIPDGPEHRHKARILYDKAVAFFQEKV